MGASHIRAESLRRIHLAAQAGETLFFMLSPLATAQDSSPSPLRLTLRPAVNGIDIGFLKRCGPQRDEPLFLPLAGPANINKRGFVENESSRSTPSRIVQPLVVPQVAYEDDRI